MSIVKTGPILDHISLPVRMAQRDATLLPNASIPSHIFRLPPSPEVDAAWEHISRDGVVVLSADEVRRAGKDPAYAVQVDPAWGYPAGSSSSSASYVAIVDAFHQIHCLNALRKGLVHNYQYYWGARYGFEPPFMWENHVNHCVDILLQDLMCHADVSPVTYTWVEDQAAPYPDFGIQRQCRDFDALVRWREANMVPDIVGKGATFTRPPGAPARPPVPGFAEYARSRITRWEGPNAVAPLTGLPPVCLAGDKK